MKRLSRVFSSTSAAVLTLSSLLAISFTGVAHAAADTCTWTGAGDGTTFSDGTNWTGCDNSNVPEAGDTLEFGTLVSGSATLTDDLGFDYAGINLVADGTGTGTDYTIDTLSVAASGTVDGTQSENGNDYVNVMVTNFTAQGDVTFAGIRFVATNYTLNGVVTLTQGAYFDGDLISSNGVVVENGSELDFVADTTSDTTPTYPITLGGGTGADPVIYFFSSGSSATTWAFANPITLLADSVLFLNSSNVTVNQTGSLTGASYALSLDANSKAGAVLTLAGSPNNSATVLGTFTATGSGIGGGGADPVAAPATPDTGFAYLTANPLLTVGLMTAAAGAIVFIARRLRFAHETARKTTHRK